MSVREEMQQKLVAAFAPVALEIADKSAAHAGHAGSRPEGETHLEVMITAPVFAGQSRLERHRAVHAALADLLATRVHSLRVFAFAPEESPSS
jgi:BolA family transcriptional regulator, general stress-responsive regulator